MKKNVLSTLGAAALVLISIVSSKPAKAQNDKKNVERTIIIRDGDTVINSKKFSDLSKSEQEKIRKELKDMKFRGDERVMLMERSRALGAARPKAQREEIVIRRNNGETRVWTPSTKGERYRFEMKDGKGIYSIEADSMIFMKSDTSLGHVFLMDRDSNSRKRVIIRDIDNSIHMPNMLDRHPNIRVDVDELRADLRRGPERMLRPGFNGENGVISIFPSRSNSQVFSFNNTDKEGYTTRINVRVSEANAEARKKISGSENIKSELDLNDLTFFPTWSSGKMNLSFSLASKGTTVVQVLDNEFKPVFIERPSSVSTYQKSFTMARNGAYYLAVSQNGSWFIRRIVKD